MLLTIRVKFWGCAIANIQRKSYSDPEIAELRVWGVEGLDVGAWCLGEDFGAGWPKTPSPEQASKRPLLLVEATGGRSGWM